VVYKLTKRTASATPTDDSIEVETSSVSKPSSPSLSAKVISETQINLTWNRPSDGGSDITGYKIEVKENSAHQRHFLIQILHQIQNIPTKFLQLIH